MAYSFSIWHTESGAVQCTCGSNVKGYVTDIGEAGNWPMFPLVSLRLGDTGQDFEYMQFRVGPLVCKQGTFHPSGATTPAPRYPAM